MLNKISLVSMTTLTGSAIKQQNSPDTLLLTDQERCGEEKSFADSILQELQSISQLENIAGIPFDGNINFDQISQMTNKLVQSQNKDGATQALFQKIVNDAAQTEAIPQDELQSLALDDRRQQFMLINDKLQKIDTIKTTIADAKKNNKDWSLAQQELNKQILNTNTFLDEIEQSYVPRNHFNQMFVELNQKGDVFKSAQAFQNTVKNRMQYMYLQLYTDNQLHKGKVSANAVQLAQMAKEDLQYFNDLAPKYFQSRWQDKCDLVSNWPSEALAECDDQAEQEGFSDMELTYCPCFNSQKQQLMMLNDGKRGIDEEDYELVEYKKGKGIKRKSERKPKGSAKLEVGQCYKFQSMNFPEHYIHNRKGQVWMDKGDFSNANFKQTTTWRVTEGNWNSNGGISISSIELDDQGEPILCAKENGNCQCSGTIFYGAIKGETLDKSKGWSKRSAEKDGDTACSNKNMGGDPLPGVPKACFCSQSEEEEAEEKAFYFDANKPDAFYNLKVKYGQGVKKLADGSFDFRNSMITYTGNNLQMRNKRNGKQENPEGMATHNWELQFSFKTTHKNTGLFQIDNPSSQGSYDRDFYLQGGHIYGYVWPGNKAKLSKQNLADGKWHSFSLICEDGTNCAATIDGKKGLDLPIDHSNFDWASRIVVGYSRLLNSQFTGQMKQIVYKSTKMSENSVANIDSAAEYVKSKKSGSELIVNEDVNINEMQFATLVYQAVSAGVNSISFEGKVNFVSTADKWEKLLMSFPAEQRSSVCLQIGKTVTSDDKDVPSIIMLNTVSGGGWKKVRHTAKGKKWSQATDLLSGSQAFGNPKDDSKSWSVKFDNEKFDEIMFATGDFDVWMTMTRKEAIGGFYAGQKRNILKSSQSCQATQAVMYRRAANKEDPWISLKDHFTASKEGLILYGENNSGGHSLALQHDGADVYIRSSGVAEKEEEPEEEEPKPKAKKERKQEPKPKAKKEKKQEKKKAKKASNILKIDNIELGQRVTRRSQWPKEYGEEDIHPEAGKIGKVVAYTDGNKKKYGASNSFINGQLQWELLVIVEYDGGEQRSFRFGYADEYWLEIVGKATKKAKQAGAQCSTAPVQVNYVGHEHCTKANPCDLGVGDCDSDEDCKPGLKCGQRDKWENLPGLIGFEKFYTTTNKKGKGDYCYDPKFYQKAAECDPNWFDPTPVEAKYLGDAACTTQKPCDIGYGDCDNHYECKHGLKCGERAKKGDKLPGIVGFEKFECPTCIDKEGDGDYCYDPDYNLKKEAVLTARKKISSILAELSENEKTFLAELSEEEDVELDEEIEEDIEENNEEEIYEEETELAEEERHRKKKEDYTPTQVQYLGDNYCTSSNKCDVGQGDCDYDSDCKTGLKCGERSHFEKLPGLTGYEKFEGKDANCGYKDCSIDKNGDSDYCYDPGFYMKAAKANPNFFDRTPVQAQYKGDSYCTKSNPCNVGFGDCDNDSDCQHGLLCGQRDKGEGLPGIVGMDKFEYAGGPDPQADGDYCFDPEFIKKANAVRKFEPFDPNPVQVVYAGDDFCTSKNPCDVGYGDCDYDSDCMEGLKCGQRGNFEKLPGLIGYENFEGKNSSCGYKDCAIDKYGNSDYCYDSNWDKKLAQYKAEEKKKPKEEPKPEKKKSQEDFSGLYEFYVGGGTQKDHTVMSCTYEGEVDLWEEVAGDRQLWRFTKLSNGLYNINVNGATAPGAEYFTASSSSKQISLTKKDPSNKLQQFELVKIGKDMFNVILPGMPAGFTYLSSRADGYVDMWAKDDGSGRQKWKLIERKVEEKEDEPKKAPKKKEKKAKKQEPKEEEQTMGDGPWASMKVVPKAEVKKAPATFIRHRNYVAWDEPVKNDLDKKDSTFIVRPATYGKGVHFESVNFPKYYMKHHNFRLRIAPISRKDLYIKDSTWIPMKVEC